MPEAFDRLVWGQALADVRGETSQDAWESRSLALGPAAKGASVDSKPLVDERAKTSF